MSEEPIHPDMLKKLLPVSSKLSVEDKPVGIGSRLRERFKEEFSEGAIVIPKEAFDRNQKLIEQLKKEGAI